MNLIPSKVGADPKKIAVLAGLVALAGFAYFYNSNPGGGSSSTPVVSRSPLAGSSPAVAQGPVGRSSFRVVQQTAGGTREFRPTLKPKNVDTANIDPTLRLDLLAKLKTVDVEGGTRSLFEVSAAPPEAIKVKEPDKIAIARPFVGPTMPKPVEPPPEPKAPPIPLKFYGFVNKTKVGDKRAFFLDGEEIVIASEGDMIKKRYKIVRIGVNSAVVEDTEFKSNNQQTLPLEAEMAG
ncbi:MAG TPA: hypothetical protein VK708_19015 [Bryobacteraceae bacterium]|jgi:hypothetical protein|nr:hypothetical protein [Bryobacteraceae bacterium]